MRQRKSRRDQAQFPLRMAGPTPSLTKLLATWNLSRQLLKRLLRNPKDAKPVLVGHYWLSGIRSALLADNVACVEYSVAKGGYLCAYRWNGEQKLSTGNFV